MIDTTEIYGLIAFKEEPWDSEDRKIMAMQDISKTDLQYEGGKEIDI